MKKKKRQVRATEKDIYFKCPWDAMTSLPGTGAQARSSGGSPFFCWSMVAQSSHLPLPLIKAVCQAS